MNLTYGRESEGHILKALKKGITLRDELEEDLAAYGGEESSRCKKVNAFLFGFRMTEFERENFSAQQASPSEV